MKCILLLWPGREWHALAGAPWSLSSFPWRDMRLTRTAELALKHVATHRTLDERQTTHLICARLKYDLYDFFRGCFWAFHTRKGKETGPKHSLKKSYRSYFRRAQIRWVIWHSSKHLKGSTNPSRRREQLAKFTEYALPTEAIWHLLDVRSKPGRSSVIHRNCAPDQGAL